MVSTGVEICDTLLGETQLTETEHIQSKLHTLPVTGLRGELGEKDPCFEFDVFGIVTSFME